MNAPRSGCPINLTLEALGDRWSLIVIRDLMFGNRRHFRELLTRSEERIASNILADRLTRLEKAGLVSRRDDPSHKQKVIYSLTEASIALVPLLAHMGGWGLRHTPASKELSVRAKILEDGGPKLWSEFMEELRHLHMHAPPPRRRSAPGCSRPTKPPLLSRWSERNDRHLCRLSCPTEKSQTASL
jgi:DNA-binding HxlR family transcriptional regulator